jgi:hypothetical protein
MKAATQATVLGDGERSGHNLFFKTLFRPLFLPAYIVEQMM